MSESEITLNDFTLSKEDFSKEVVGMTREYGAAVIPNFVDGAVLEALQKDFHAVIEDEDPEYIHKVNYPAGRAVVANLQKMPREKYAAATEFFSRPEITAVAQEYIGQPCQVNYGMYVTHEFNDDVQIAPTHFDKMWTLKFMLYINDIGLDEGAFGVIPKSTPFARQAVRSLFDENNTDSISTRSPIYRQMNNEKVPPSIGKVVDIIGSAGTLIVFDTDTFHHAGNVKPGHERKIMRAHSGPEIVYPTIDVKSRQWWRGEKAYGLH